MLNIKEIHKVYTHSGVFHADEVSCVALLKILGFTGEVIRTPKAPEAVHEDEIVIDIGGRYDDDHWFDHHQADCPVRENGVKYATFGLLVRHFGICNEPGFENFDTRFACGIDARDNGQWDLLKEYPSPIGELVRLLNPNWDSEESVSERFEEAVALVQRVIELEFDRRRSGIRADEQIKKAVEAGQNGVIILDGFLPWKDSLKRVGNVCGDGTWVKCAVFPSRGEWVSFTLSGVFPAEWNTNPPEGCNSAHAAGFMIACETKERCIELCSFIAPKPKKEENK
jgi:uncharacterized UPF0160 family protein